MRSRNFVWPKTLAFFCSAFVLLSVSAFAQESKPEPTPPPITGKTPVIIIPGITGSVLINKNTDKTVWFGRRRAKDDDLDLPMFLDPLKNVDDLIATDIIRGVKLLKFLPEVEIYDNLIDSLQKQGGYTEASWDNPGEDGHRDKFYVFAYDWRRDNVETAHLLIKRIEDLRKKLGKPDLKFNIIAHSMGGLITRYAAMYGKSPLPTATPKPNWSGAKYFDHVFLLGTPNEGSIYALEALLNGYSHTGIKLPFVRDISRFDIFTIPSIYQLLPHVGSLYVFDESLRRVDINIYDPTVWTKYGWSIELDKKFKKRFSEREQQRALPFFKAMLANAYAFQSALSANRSRSVPVKFYLIGSDCKETAAAMLLIRDEKASVWKTIFKPISFTNSSGEKIDAEKVKELLISNGDGTVTMRSLAGQSSADRGKEILPIEEELYQCSSHTKLIANSTIQQRMFEILAIAAEEKAMENAAGK